MTSERAHGGSVLERVAHGDVRNPRRLSASAVKTSASKGNTEPGTAATVSLCIKNSMISLVLNA